MGSALLVSINRVMRRPLERETGNRYRFSRFSFLNKQYDCQIRRTYRQLFTPLNYCIMSAKNIIENYEAPQVEIVEVEVEKGFAVSGEGWDDGIGNG